MCCFVRTCFIRWYDIVLRFIRTNLWCFVFFRIQNLFSLYEQFHYKKFQKRKYVNNGHTTAYFTSDCENWIAMRTRLCSVIFITASTVCRRIIRTSLIDTDSSLRYIICCGCKASLILIKKDLSRLVKLLNSLYGASSIIQSCKSSQ
jgi:hypothetical protein